MNRKTPKSIDVRYDKELIEVVLLAPTIARVLDPWFCLELCPNDIVRIDHDPGEGEGVPEVVEILHRCNPVLSEVEFGSGKQRDRIIALAAVLARKS